MKLSSTEFELAGFTYRAELRRNGEFVFYVKGNSQRFSKEYDPFVHFGDDSYYCADNYGNAPLGPRNVFKLKARITAFFTNLLKQRKSPKFLFFNAPSPEKASIYLTYAKRIGETYGYRVSVDQHCNVLLTREDSLRQG